jgi:hypothetical protein
MTQRMKGAALLDAATYEELEADTTATGQAAGVVAIVAVAAALGSWNLGPFAMVGGALTALVGWGLWAAVTWVIGDKLLGGTATWGELLRTLGFAQTPGLLAVLYVLPFTDWLVGIVIFVWMLAAGVVAIRQALDFGTGKAILTGLLGLVAVTILRGIFLIG